MTTTVNTAGQAGFPSGAWEASRFRRFLGWMRREPAAAAALAFLTLLALMLAFAPLITWHSPETQDFANSLQGPSWNHPFGTDDLGRDMWARVIYGGRVSVLAAFLAVIVATVLGTPIGVLTGYVGGKVDDAAMRVVDTLMSFPAIILAIAVTAALGPGVRNAMIAVGIVLAPIYARLMRGQVMSVKGDLYVEAARSFGARHRHVVFRHIIPNSIQPVIVQSALTLAVALIAEASLSFLGLGVQPPQPSWGVVLGRAYRNMYSDATQMLYPGGAIVLTVLCFNTLGDTLRVLLDPITRRSR